MKTKIKNQAKKPARSKVVRPSRAPARSAHLPKVLTRYIAAANRYQVAAATECFASDATVHDEAQDHVGDRAIRAWIEETTRKYRPTFSVMGASVAGDEITLSVAVSGQFPGSPVTLDYEIRLRDGKISTLSIE